MNHPEPPEPDEPTDDRSDAAGVAMPVEPVISSPAEFIDVFAEWVTNASPVETGEAIHRYIDHRRQHAEHSDDEPPVDGGLVLGDPDCPDG